MGTTAMKYFSIFTLAILCFSLSSCSNNSSDTPKVCLNAKKEQNLSKRIELYTKCIETNKLATDELMNFYLYRGISYDISQQYQNAISDFNKALEIKPENVSINVAIGDSYRKSGDFKKSINSYDKAIQASPNNAQAYNKRGISYGQLHQYERAIDDFDKAVKLNPKDSSTLYARGYTYSLIGQHKHAIDDFNKIIELKPTDQGSYFYRAISYEKSGQYEQAIADYNKVIELNPKDPSNYASLANLYLTAKENKYINAGTAVTLAQKATELTKEQNSSYLNTLAAAYAKLGQFDNAVETQSKAVNIVENKGNKSLFETYQKVLTAYQEKRAPLPLK